MSEKSVSLTQRVEALEQISHARVMDRVGQVEQRVPRIESGREAEEPRVANKADIVRLETLIVEKAEHNRLKRKPYKSKFELDQLYILVWMVTIAIALAGAVIAATAFIMSQLP